MRTRSIHVSGAYNVVKDTEMALHVEGKTQVSTTKNAAQQITQILNDPRQTTPVFVTCVEAQEVTGTEESSTVPAEPQDGVQADPCPEPMPQHQPEPGPVSPPPPPSPPTNLVATASDECSPGTVVTWQAPVAAPPPISTMLPATPQGHLYLLTS